MLRKRSRHWARIKGACSPLCFPNRLSILVPPQRSLLRHCRDNRFRCVEDQWYRGEGRANGKLRARLRRRGDVHAAQLEIISIPLTLYPSLIVKRWGIVFLYRLSQSARGTGGRRENDSSPTHLNRVSSRDEPDPVSLLSSTTMGDYHTLARGTMEIISANDRH